jgi:hypothetical protein
VLVVWSDNLDGIIPLCRDFEDHLIKLVWTQRNSLAPSILTPGASVAATPAVMSANNSASDVELNEKSHAQDVDPRAEPEPSPKPVSGGSLWGWRIRSRANRAAAPRDLENGRVSARPTRYFAPVYGGLGLALSTCKLYIFVTRQFVLTGILYVPTRLHWQRRQHLTPRIPVDQRLYSICPFGRGAAPFLRFARKPAFYTPSPSCRLSPRGQFFSLQVITNVSYV